MKAFTIIFLATFFLSSSIEKQTDAELAKKILEDQTIRKVDAMARELMKKGFYAGSGYQMVWARDLNTFIELSCEEYDTDVIRENLLMFFHFQQPNGEMLDGYVPREAFTWGDPNPYYSPTAPDHVGFKNTVETDQETSVIQAIYKYVMKTGDRSILEEVVAGKTVFERMLFSIDFLRNERFSPAHMLIKGATTFDWGDVQVEGGAVVDVDSLTHWSIDIYDNAMLSIALGNLSEMAPNDELKYRFNGLKSDFKLKIREHLWDKKMKKFIPHIYLEGPPFPDDFDERSIYYHGGTAVAIEAGILYEEEIAKVLEQMKTNVELSGAPSIGLTLYPPYPEEVLGENVSKPFTYQNGGDWTWFGGRMIQQLIAYGFVEEAYELAQPMFERVVANDGFYEWYSMDNSPQGSAEFKGSAGVLAKSISMFYEWAEKNK